MQAFITSVGNISPQNTFEGDRFPDELVGVESNSLACIEPDYRNLINPVQLRRMPRILKMALASSQTCIHRSPVANPDAIVVGTGLGCLENLEKFLCSVLDDNEHVLSVLPFINSTHNAVAAQIAMLLKNHNYNITYCHRGFSFESALSDALMLIQENEATHVLVGGIDECTQNFIYLHSYLGYWKQPVNNLQLLKYKTPGTIAGEGSAFFMLSARSEMAYAKINAATTFLNQNLNGIEFEIEAFLEQEGFGKTDIDLVIFGNNGDIYMDKEYYHLQKTFFDSSSVYAYYKHLCGEYYTSTAFALWLGAVIIKNQHVPDDIKLNTAYRKEIKRVLIYNNTRGTEHSLILLSQPE